MPEGLCVKKSTETHRINRGVRDRDLSEIFAHFYFDYKIAGGGEAPQAS